MWSPLVAAALRPWCTTERAHSRSHLPCVQPLVGRPPTFNRLLLAPPPGLQAMWPRMRLTWTWTKTMCSRWMGALGCYGRRRRAPRALATPAALLQRGRRQAGRQQRAWCCLCWLPAVQQTPPVPPPVAHAGPPPAWPRPALQLIEGVALVASALPDGQRQQCVQQMLDIVVQPMQASTAGRPAACRGLVLGMRPQECSSG